jgi:type II secretory pathway component PulF
LSVYRLSNEELSIFTYELGVLLKSGIPLIEGLVLMKDDRNNKHLFKVLDSLVKDVETGRSLYESLSTHREFPQYMLSIIKNAQESGTLDRELERLSDYYSKQDRLNSKIVKSVTYPIILLVLMMVVFGVLLVNVIPVFENILTSLGANIPPFSKFLFNFSSIIGNNLVGIIVTIIILTLILFLYFKTDAGKKSFDKFLIYSSITRNVYRKILGSKFSQAMGLMLGSGLTYEKSLLNTIEIFNNKVVKERLEKNLDSFLNNMDFYEYLKNVDLFPDMFMRMVKVGSKTGEIDNVFLKISQIYEVNVDKALDKSASTIEPVLVGLLSVIIGGVLISVILPLVDILSAIG